ncbi:MAG: Chemoreceptor glutamine deamidase CheD [Fimbriimonadaceae bacterium]|nr:Chemoreceptor glutamine deamidase CheD [Fimbriimonadaceae bacterium]
MSLVPEVVGMAEIKVSSKPTLYSRVGLGSCIAIIAFDSSTSISGFAHVMLPQSFKDRPVDRAAKFVDTAVPALFDEMIAHGAERSKISFAIVGGAQIFQFGRHQDSGNPAHDLGARNVQSAFDVFAQQGITKFVGQDTGGTLGRVVTFHSESGEIRVRTLAKGERILCKFEVVEGEVECRQR